MDPRFQPDRPLVDETRRIAGELVAAALRIVNEPGRPSERVHAVRAQLKRLRALLRLVRSELGEAAFAAEKERLGAITDRLAGSRDAKVVDEALERLARRADSSTAVALLRFRAALQARRDAVPSPVDGAPGEEIAALLARAARHVADLPLEGAAPATLDQGVRRVAKKARERLAEAAARPSPEALHGLRRRVKDLRFQADLLADVRGKARRKLVRRLDRLGDALGAEHDLAIVLDAMRSGTAPLTATEDAQVLAIIDERRTRLRARALRRAADLVDGALAGKILGHSARALADEDTRARRAS